VNPEPIVTESAEETIAIGRALAARLAAPVLVLLKGDLGAGKTTLVKGIISGLGAAQEEEVTSPTFTLVHVFQPAESSSPDRKASPKVYHVDLYRVEGQHELESLALEDVLGSFEPGIVIVEWSERLTIRSDWPLVRVELEHLGGDKRSILIRQAEAPTPESPPA
jgi:tRNA threonylcarbamoyladenosine biosynthesis protein TsaE